MRVQEINNSYFNNRYNYNSDTTQQNKSSENKDNRQQGVSFKGAPGKPNFIERFWQWVGKKTSKYYVEPLMNNPKFHEVVEKFTGSSKLMTTHLATVGSVLTSSVYMWRTLTNPDLDPDKRTTLSINQFFGCLAPAIITYKAEHSLKDFNKNLEYDYAGRQMRKLALGKVPPSKVEEFEQNMGKRLKGFPVLMSLFTFTLIYRYLTPVAITPLANWLGEKFNNKKSQQVESDDNKSLDVNKPEIATKIEMNNTGKYDKNDDTRAQKIELETAKKDYKMTA